MLILSKKECVQYFNALATYFKQPNKLSFVPTFLEDYRKIKCQELHEFMLGKQQEYVLLQSYIASDPIEFSGKHYDATGRMVLFLRKDISGQCEVDVVDGYWKLPEQSIEEGGSHESARLSHVSAEDRKGSARFTSEQSTSIRFAFRLLSNEFKPLLASKVDFYTDNFLGLSFNEQGLLNRFFTEQIFDTVQSKHFKKLCLIAKVNSELATVLVRTLMTELSSFVWLSQKNKEESKFLQPALLSYLADEHCPIDFKKVVYGNGEREGLRNFLLFLTTIPNCSEVFENAKKLLSKI